MATQAETHKELPDALLHFDHLPDSAQVNQNTVQALLGCGATSVWRWVKNGTLPPPLRLGRALRWRVGDLRVLLNSRDETAR